MSGLGPPRIGCIHRHAPRVPFNMSRSHDDGCDALQQSPYNTCWMRTKERGVGPPTKSFEGLDTCARALHGHSRSLRSDRGRRVPERLGRVQTLSAHLALAAATQPPAETVLAEERTPEPHGRRVLWIMGRTRRHARPSALDQAHARFGTCKCGWHHRQIHRTGGSHRGLRMFHIDGGSVSSRWFFL